MKTAIAKFFNRLENLPGETIKPNFCCFGVIDTCMLRCRMCHKWMPDAAQRPGDTLPSLAQWKNAIHALRSITEPGFLINFGGGEPFLMDGILELVRYAREQGFKTNIATNAFLIDEAMAREIARSGLTTMNISLDGVNPSTHDHLRGTDGVYRKVYEAIEYLHTHAPVVKKGICSVISAKNAEEIIPLIEAVQNDDRLEWIYFMAVMQPNNTARDEQWHKHEFSFLWPSDTALLTRVLDTLIRLRRQGYKIVNQTAQLKAFQAYFSHPEKFVKLLPCNLSKAVHISSVGDVFICFNKERLGNIKEDSVDALWYSDRAAAIRDSMVACKENCHFLINCFFEGDFPFAF